MPLLPFNSVGGYSTGITATAVIDSLGNITGVGATFSGLIRANAGISASGATFSGNISAPNIVTSFNGSTGAVTGVTVGGTNVFTALNTFNAGISASGATFNTVATMNLRSNALSPSYPLYINNLQYSQTAIGDWDGVGATTYIFVNDDNGNILFNAPASGIEMFVEPGRSLTVYDKAYFNNLEINGVTATFTGLLSASKGISASGGTFANDIAVNSMTIGRGNANIATNIAFGASAYFSGTTGANNVAIGLNALRLNQAGDINTAIGAGALQSNVNGRNNVALGWNALNTLNTATWSALSQAEYNVAIGGNALGAATISSNNIAIGAAAAQAITTSNSNVAIGTYTLLKCGAGGGDNVAIGTQAMVGSGAVTTQGYNTSIGANSLFNIAAANYNTAVGHSTAFSSTTGSFNSVIGAFALYHATTLVNSIAIGYQAGRYAGITGGSNLTSSTNSVYIGSGSKSGFTTSSNEIVIGTNSLGLGSNTTVIGGTATTSATIYGLLNAPNGISASGATFSGNVTTQGILYIDNIENRTGHIYIDNTTVARVAIGEYEQNGNNTCIFLRDATSTLDITNPLGAIRIGDINGYGGGSIEYDATSSTLSGVGGSVIIDFYSISATNELLENNRRVTTNARSWFL